MRKKLLWLFIILTALSTLVYVRHILTGDIKEEKTPAVRVVEERRTPLFIPHYLALQLGFFEEQNIEVKTVTLEQGQNALELLQEGKAGVILAGPGQVILTGPPRKASSPVAFAEITQRNGAFFLAREEKPHFQWTDVKRRTIISGPPTEDNSLVLEYILRRHEISPNWQVNVIENLPPHLRPGTFKSGSASFLVAEEPAAGMLESQGAGKVVASLGRAAGKMPAAVYISKPSYLDTNSREVQKLVNGLYKAQQWMTYHSAAEIADAVREFFPGYHRDMLISIIERYKKIDLWGTNPVIDKLSYENLYQAVESSGELVNKTAYSKAVTNRFAKKAVKEIHYVPEDKQKPKPGFNWPYIKSLFK